MKEIIWSACSNDSCLALQGFVRSLRSSGYSGPVVAWSDFHITGADNIPLDYSIPMDNAGMWKFEYFKKMQEAYPDSILAYFSPQHYVSAKLPFTFDEVMKEEKAMSFLESNIVGDSSRKEEWCGVQGFRLYDASRSFGNLRDSYYNLNANHFFVRPEFSKDFSLLIQSASEHLTKRGYKLSDELCLSMVMNLIGINIENVLLKSNYNFYGIDLLGAFKDKLPDGNPWETADWITGERSLVNPALSYIPSNVNSLRNLGRVSLGPRISKDPNSPVNKTCGACQRSKPQITQPAESSEGKIEQQQ